MNGHSELVIDRVSKEDSGTYTCIAENNVGTIKSLGFVYVKGKLFAPIKKKHYVTNSLCMNIKLFSCAFVFLHFRKLDYNLKLTVHPLTLKIATENVIIVYQKKNNNLLKWMK